MRIESGGCKKPCQRQRECGLRRHGSELAVGQCIDRPAGGEPKRGRAASHGFQESDAEAFSSRGHNEEISHPIDVGEDVLAELGR